MEELWKGYTRPAIRNRRVYPFSVPSDKRLCLTSVKDMGAVAARCVLENFDGALDVVSDALTPREMAAAFSAAQGGPPVAHRQAWLLFVASRVLLPELHAIIRFYRGTDFRPYIASTDLRDALPGLPPLQTFAAFLDETRWADADRSYDDLAR